MMNLRAIRAAMLAGLTCAATPALAQPLGGWYGGVEAKASGRTLNSTPDGALPANGASIGVTVGQWMMSDRYALGWDIGLTFGGSSHSQSDATFSYQFKETFAASARFKVGVPVGGLLIYGAAGPQIAIDQTDFEWISFGGPTTTTKTWGGLTLAAGLETKLTDHMSLRGEIGYDVIYLEKAASRTFYGPSAKLGLSYYFN